MSKRKKQLAWCVFTLAILIVAVPFLLQVAGLRLERLLRFIGVRYLYLHWVLFASAACVTVVAALQFPFREEEGWTCNCGYDLSYARKESTCCPECGRKVSLEYSRQIGQFSSQTNGRIGLTILLFLLSGSVIILGLLVRMLNAAASC